MTNYAKNVPDCNNQSLHHFISDSPWDERPVIDHIQRDVVELIGDKINGAIHIDESGFPKEGKNSVGVKRQYCGRFGKIENCQVGVFLGYTSGTYRTLIDEALYLPKDWAEDRERRKKCGVPENVVFKTKGELAFEMTLHARDNNDVRILKDQLDKPWKHILIRDAERKELWSNIACIRVHPVVDKLPGDELWLIIRKDDGEKTTKYQFSNAPLDTDITRFAQMSCSRCWIERAIEDAKGAGLADYQIRKWTGWHHHITMTLFAMFVILTLYMDLGKRAPLLTVQDVKEILEVIMPKDEITDKGLLDLIKEKHRARYSARKSHHRRNR